MCTLQRKIAEAAQFIDFLPVSRIVQNKINTTFVNANVFRVNANVFRVNANADRVNRCKHVLGKDILSLHPNASEIQKHISN